MYIAYSALNGPPANAQQFNTKTIDEPESELLLRYRAYETICNKYNKEIIAIQQYLPGWVPKFR